MSIVSFSSSPASSRRSNSSGSVAMGPFHDGHYVRLQSCVHGTYLHADEDGHGVSLSPRRASMNAAWAVHSNPEDDQHVLLYSAAYGRYLAATDASASRGCPGFRVEQRNCNELEEEAIRWHAVKTGSGDAIVLRHAAGDHDRYRYLRANGRRLPWKESVVSVDYFKNISTMMEWLVEPIPSTELAPPLPRPNRFRRHLSALLPTRRVDFIGIGQVFFDNPVAFDFSGRSVFRLRSDVARWMGIRRERNIPDDFVMYVRAGVHGRFTPLVVDLPRSSQALVITVGPPAPANAAPGYPDVNAE